MNMMNMPHYQQHLAELDRRWSAALGFAGFDAAVVAAGAPQNYFLDDQPPPFRPNPHFAQWFPERDCAHALLLIRPGSRARLFFHQPRDYWHQPPSVPEWVPEHLDVALFDDLALLDDAVAAATRSINRVAWIGEQAPGNLGGFQHNPALLLDHLHFDRAVKTDFEIDCLIAASERAVAGHVAARAAFAEGASEFHTHLRYLLAAGQPEAELPYHSIVAHNRHAGVLHYQHYDLAPPQPLRSLLIDAGASAHLYAADVTRTYAAVDAPGADRFAALVDDLDRAQQQLIADIAPGINYVAVHEAAHRAVAALLAEHDLVRCSAEAAFDAGLTRVFLPHGVGHLIGLQTHDVGGQQRSREGGQRPPPPEYPALRLTRDVLPGQVFTIEPGLYFIPMLLEEAAAGPLRDLVRWDTVEALSPFGGIRIEDNVLVTEHGTRNFTREAFARHA
jgi:Xaa-Pro dipeptidase